MIAGEISRKYKFLLVCTLALLLSACSKNSDDKNKILDKNITLGIAHCCNISNIFTYRLISGAIKEAKKDDKINIQFLTADENKEKQINQIKQHIQDDKNALLISATTDGKFDLEHQKEVFKIIKQADIPAVFYVKGINKPVFRSYDKAYFIGVIPEESAILQAEMVVKHWLKNPQWDKNNDGVIQYVILKGSTGNIDAETRTKWVASTIEHYPGKNVKAENLGIATLNWSRNQAEQQMVDWINNGDVNKIELVISNSDEMALGAMDALRRNQLKIPMFGMNAVPDGLKSIRDKGMLVGTVSQNMREQSKEALNLAVNLAAGFPPSNNSKYKIVNRELMVSNIAIDSDNVNEYMNNK